MREIDQALARAYARGATGWPPRPTALPSPRAPTSPCSDPGARRHPSEARLAWPETIRALEREHGDRFDRLADALIEARDRLGQKVLLFTSCHRAEGRTTLVLTLARALARRPGRTLLVDGDLERPDARPAARPPPEGRPGRRGRGRASPWPTRWSTPRTTTCTSSRCEARSPAPATSSPRPPGRA